MDLNKVFLIGNLTRDPVLRYSQGGAPVCELGLAVNRRYRRGDGEQVEETCFVDVVVWARQAETCNQYLQKGSGAIIEGRLQFDSWQTPEGQKRSKLRVRADRVQFMPRGGGGGRSSDSGDTSDFGSDYSAEGAVNDRAPEYDPDVPF